MNALIRAVAFVVVLLLGATADARVSRIEIVSRADFREGASFGAAGPYERIRGRVFYALDPDDPHNRIIADLDRAPRNARGEVELSGDVDILRPKRAAADGVLLVSVPNRGGRLVINDAAQDEWYLRQGYTIAEVAWQFDVREDPALLHFTAPVASGIRGRVRSDFVVAQKQATHTITHFIGGAIGGTGYPVADRENATLTERDAPLGRTREIPRARWRFTDDRTIAKDGGFVPGRIYEITYLASDPAVVGAGLAAVRDFVSHCKHDPSSPARARYVYGVGVSQTGRFLRHFVWQGFNADEAGRQVFDGLLVLVAGAGRGNFNHRFAQPSRDAQPLAPALDPVDVFPFTDAPTVDVETGRKAGLLDRARAERVVPKIVYVNTAYEYWSRAGSLVHTTPDGARDVAPPETTRIYFIAGFGHIGSGFPPALAQGSTPRGQQPVNPNGMFFLRHAFVAALDDWVRRGIEPPASRVPKIADGTLVAPSRLALQSIRGVAVPTFAYDAPRVRGAAEPPNVSGTFTSLVPQVGADGNELAGVRVPALEAPVATYTGWNLRHADTGFPTYRASFVGSFIAWPKSEILARYGDRDGYVDRFEAAARRLVDERLLVAEDVPRLLVHAREMFEWIAR